MFRNISLNQRRFIPPVFVLTVLFSAVFIFGVNFTARGATFDITAPSTCYTPGSSALINWNSSTMSGVNNYSVHYTTGSNLTDPRYPITSYVSIPPYNWNISPGFPHLATSLRFIVSAYSGTTLLEEAISSTFYVQTTCMTNTAPPAPVYISGPGSGGVGISYNYTAYLNSDPDGDGVQAVFDWGDGTSFGYSTFSTTTGTSSVVSHTWNTAGPYTVRVKAKDSRNAESSWSTYTWSVNISGGGGCTSIPSAPTTFNAVPSSSNVALTWSAPGTCSYHYNLYRSTPTGNNNWQSLPNASGSTFTQTYYTDTSVTTGSSYDYRIEACLSGYGCSGINSNYIYTNNISLTGSTNYPDFVVSSYNISPTSPIIGTSTTFSGTVMNQGSAASTGNIAVQLTFTGPSSYPYTTQVVSSLAVSGSQNVTFASWTPTVSGSYTYKICADSSSVILEGNENNNCTGDIPFTVSSSSGGQYTLTVTKSGNGTVTSSPAGISCPAACSSAYYSFSSGQSVTLTAVPDGGYTFSGWGGGYCSGTLTSCVVTMNASKTVTATFTVSGTVSAPSAPSGLIAAVSGNNVTLNWTDNSNNETGFKVYRGPTWTDMGDVGANVTTFTNSNVSMGSYQYKVQAFAGDSGNRVYSNVSNVIDVTVTSGGSGGDTTAPVISAIGYRNVIGTGAQIIWNTDDVADSRVYYGTASNSLTLSSENRCDTGGNVIAHCVNLTGLTHNTTYYYKVESKNAALLNTAGAINSFVSATSSGTLPTGVPSVPTNFRLDPAPTTNPPVIYLKWDDTVTEDKYNLERSIVGQNNWIYFPQLSANTTTYTDTTVGTSIYYDYRLQACLSGSGCSSYVYLNNISTGIATTTTGLPAAPTNLQSDSTTTATAISLKWNDNSDNETRFIVEKRYPGTTAWFILIEKPTGITTHLDSAVSSGVNYDYRVWSYREGYGRSATAAELYGTHTLISTTSNVGSVYGKVTISDGSVIASARVNIKNADYTVNLWKDTTTDGSYQFSDLSVGSYTVIAYPPYDRGELGSSSSQNASVAVGGNLLINLQLAYGTKTVHGKVVKSSGSYVTNARIDAWRSDGQTGYRTATVDSSGVYSLLLNGGTWKVQIYPIYGTTSPDWSYTVEPMQVIFMSDTSTETRAIDFTVTAVTSYVSGKVVKPDGTVPTANTVNISFVNSTTRIGAGGPITSADGSFRFALPAGNYEVNIYSTDASYAAPYISVVSVGESQVKDLGLITLIRRAEKITGRVLGPSGEGVANVEVQAGLTGGSGFVKGISSANGYYELNVSYGTWHVYLNSLTLGSFSYSGQAKDIFIASGTTVSFVDFMLSRSSTFISGKVIDSTGKVLDDFYGPVSIMPQEGFGTGTSSYGAYVERGIFTASIPPGNYTVQVYPASGSVYAPSSKIYVSILNGQTANVVLVVAKSDAVLSGTIKSSAGSLVTGISAFVFATDDKGSWRETEVGATTGQYRMILPAGIWRVGLRITSSSYAPPTYSSVTLVSGQTLTHDIVLAASNAILTGKVTDSAGTGIANVQVSADFASFSQASTSGAISSFRAVTDSTGLYRINLPAGSYYLHVFVGANPNLIAPEEQSVVLMAAETKTINLTLRSPDATLSGKVLESGQGRAAVVWAWGDKGGNASVKAGADGTYSLRLSPGKWHIGSSYDRDQILFRSVEYVVDSVSLNQTLDIILVAVNLTLPDPVVKATSANTEQIITNEQGATLNIPANAIASSGTVTVSFSPTADAASQGLANVVGVAYQVQASDSTGQSVSLLNAPVTLRIPYDETESGTNENNLQLAYWDDALGTWQNITSSVVDTINNIVTGTVIHLTRFAIVRPADITPPNSPSVVRARVETGKVTLSWLNPTSDFHSARIYRSLVAGEIGSKIADSITATSWADSTIQNGIRYYYNIKAVDLAGNESTSIAQTSVVGGQITTGVIGPYPSGTLFRTSNSSTVWYVENGQRRSISSPAIFESRFDWKNIKTITDNSHTDLYTQGSPVLFPDGVLVKGSAPTVFVISDGKKLPITSATVFAALGYKWENIKIVSDTDLALHTTGANLSSTATYPSGSLLQKDNDPTVWYVDKGVRRGFPTLDVFNVRKFSFSNVVKLSASILESMSTGTPLSYPDYTLVKGSSPEVYFVEAEKRRHITSAEIFNANQYDWSAIRTIPDSVLNILSLGSSL